MILYAELCSGDTETRERPKFPESFTASVIFQVPYVYLDLPIQVEVDGHKGTQVVHFFNDLTTEYVSQHDRVILRNVFNQTERVCLDESPDPKSNTPVELVSIFPVMDDFEFSGMAVLRGLQVERWTRNTSRPGEMERFYYDPFLSFPVRWTMHSREEIFDSHVDDYIVDYVSINPLYSIPKPAEVCQTSVRTHTNGPSTAKTGVSHLKSLLRHHRHTSKKDSFSMGYVPRIERPAVQIFGDNITAGDLPDLASIDVPDNFDWRKHGGSPTPKDQAMCGSCYAFAVIGAIESQLMLRRNFTEPISEQFLLDCGWGGISSSCSGGSQEELGQTILERFDGKIPLDRAYGQYMSTYSYCKNTTEFATASIDGWVNLPSRSPTEHIKKFLMSFGILSVSINAVSEVLVYNGENVISTDACKNTKIHELDHAVNLVGFGKNETDGSEYWILRNSWSTNWGDKGFFKLEMGERDCGVTLDVSFPIVKQIHTPKAANPETHADVILS